MARIAHFALPARPEDLTIATTRLERYFAPVSVHPSCSPTAQAVWLDFEGIWVHLIARASAAIIPSGGTWTPHVCFHVPSVDRLADSVRNDGVECWSAGTLPDRVQLWVRCAPSVVVEVQEESSMGRSSLRVHSAS